MAQAIADQARKLCYFSPFGIIGTPPSIELAERLSRHAPGDLKHVFFTTDGSTAVDSALRFIHFLNNFKGKRPRSGSSPGNMPITAAPCYRPRSPASRPIVAIWI